MNIEKTLDSIQKINSTIKTIYCFKNDYQENRKQLGTYLAICELCLEVRNYLIKKNKKTITIFPFKVVCLEIISDNEK